MPKTADVFTPLLDEPIGTVVSPAFRFQLPPVSVASVTWSTTVRLLLEWFNVALDDGNALPLQRIWINTHAEFRDWHPLQCAVPEAALSVSPGLKRLAIRLACMRVLNVPSESVAGMTLQDDTLEISQELAAARGVRRRASTLLKTLNDANEFQSLVHAVIVWWFFRTYELIVPYTPEQVSAVRAATDRWEAITATVGANTVLRRHAPLEGLSVAPGGSNDSPVIQTRRMLRIPKDPKPT